MDCYSEITLVMLPGKYLLVCVFSAISDLLVAPLQERMDDWKKTVVSLDREHSRGQLISES